MAILPKYFSEKLCDSLENNIFAERKWQYCQNISI